MCMCVCVCVYACVCVFHISGTCVAAKLAAVGLSVCIRVFVRVRVNLCSSVSNRRVGLVETGRLICWFPLFEGLRQTKTQMLFIHAHFHFFCVRHLRLAGLSSVCACLCCWA